MPKRLWVASMLTLPMKTLTSLTPRCGMNCGAMIDSMAEVTENFDGTSYELTAAHYNHFERIDLNYIICE